MSIEVRKNARDFLMKIQRTKNKKNIDAGIMDAILEDRKNVLDLNLVVGLDVSGSISSTQFSQFMAQIDAIKGLSRVKVIEVDTEVVAFYDYFKMPQRSVARLRGGGGTNFHDAFQLIGRLNPDAVLFMTDGEVCGHVRAPACPVGWILTAGGRHPYGFGEVVVHLP